MMFIITYLVSFLLLFSLSSSAPPNKPLIDDDPEGPTHLTPKDFHSTIQNGTWWVDFFSPYCPHCRQLAPDWTLTWKILKSHNVEKEFDFHMAKVDCVEYGDLCNDQEIGAYPSLRLYKDGKLITQYKDLKRKSEDLVEFANKHMNGGSSSSVSGTATKSQSTATSNGDNATSMVKPTGKVKPTNTYTQTSQTSHEFPQYTGAQVTVNSVFPGSKPTPSSIANSNSNLPNPDGLSVQLDHLSFNRKITATNDPWFVKFHSPRCPHCVAMKSAWDQMAHTLKGKIHVGEINCDVERQLCKDAQINELPSLYYFSGTTKTPYNSLRGFADLLEFANGAINANNLPDINSIEELKSAVDGNNDKATVVYFYDKTTVDEDFEAIKRVATDTIEFSRIYKSNSTELAKEIGVSYYPSIYAISDVANKRWIQLVAPTPKDIRDHGRISNWIKEIWLSFVPQLTPINAQEIFNHAEYVVLALIDPRDKKSKDRAIFELKVSAQKYLDDVEKETLEELMDLRAKKQLKIDEAADKGDEKAEDNAKNIKVKVTPKPVVGFAWIDSVFWNRYLRSKYGIDKIDKPVVIINDKSNSRYWDVNTSGNQIEASRSVIIDTLEAILGSPQKIQPKVVITGFNSFIWYIRLTISQHWLITSIIFIGIFAYFSRRRQNNYSELTLPVHGPVAGKLD